MEAQIDMIKRMVEARLPISASEIAEAEEEAKQAIKNSKKGGGVVSRQASADGSRRPSAGGSPPTKRPSTKEKEGPLKGIKVLFG